MATSIRPNPYLKAAEGLYLDSHILDTVEASAMIKNELRIENQDTLISEASLLNS
ncbi:hypothetical protein D3C72_2536710 [compost metagenome]